jgi:hypothetical protein
MNGDGDWDVGDTGIAGWHITLYRWDTASGAWVMYDETDTDASGYYEFTVCEGGDYKVAEESMDGWIATSPTSYEFTAVSGQAQTFDFFNFELGEICGEKWYDFDKDGIKDSDEDFIEGFKIELYKDGNLFDTAFTDANGEYCFSDLGPGVYEVVEVLPNDPSDYEAWGQTYPSEGSWIYDVLTSGFETTDADFGNVVEFTGGLTYGYWKTHTGLDSPPRDDAYDLLGANPFDSDVNTPVGPHMDGDDQIENEWEAKWIFDGADSGDSPNCSGEEGVEKCRSLFRAQLLALHMNLLKFPGMDDAVFVYGSDSHSGDTVQEIYDEAIDLLNDGGDHDFTSFMNTLDLINNNGHYGPGDHVLVIPTPPVPDYS